MTTHYANEDGWCDWVSPKMKGYELICCDCGLTHEVEFKVVKFLDAEPVDGLSEFVDIEDDNVQVLLRMKRKEQS